MSDRLAVSSIAGKPIPAAHTECWTAPVMRETLPTLIVSDPRSSSIAGKPDPDGLRWTVRHQNTIAWVGQSTILLAIAVGLGFLCGLIGN